MTSEDNNWPVKTDEAALDRYLKDARDLSSSINAGQRVSDLRNLVDISVSDLANRCDITTQELLALEAGMMQLTPAIATRLASNLGVKFEDLYLSDDKKA